VKRQLAFEPEQTPEQVRFLEERLYEFNATATDGSSRLMSPICGGFCSSYLGGVLAILVAWGFHIVVRTKDAA
jgi:hypothetical protein